jgi:hypothetical protein
MEEKETKKLSYEQLEQIAGNLSAQLQQAQARLQQETMFNAFKRLDYLFKVIESPIDTFTTDFRIKCAEEIEDSLTIPDEVKNAELDKPVETEE